MRLKNEAPQGAPPKVDSKPLVVPTKVVDAPPPAAPPKPGATEGELTAQYERAAQHSTIPEPGYHTHAEVPTTHSNRRGDWLNSVSASGIDAKIDSKQAKALLDQAVADYHRDVTGGTMRTLVKDELLGLASLLTGKHSALLDKLREGFDDKTIYPNRPAVLLGADPDGPTVWFMGWRKGEFTDIHSHNETQGSVSVHRGRVREKTWDPETGNLQHNREFKRGEGAAIPTPYIHQVANERDELATTIHAYHPPLYMMELYRLDDGKAVMTGRWEDDERVEWEARQKAKGAS